MNTRKEVVNGIKLSLQRHDRVALVEEYIADGCTAAEILEAINGTEFRFRLYRSGLRIEIAEKRELQLELCAAITLLEQMAEKLVVQDMLAVHFSKQIEQIRIRTEVARQAHAVERTHYRLNDFLLPTEQVNFVEPGLVDQVLKPVGFEWRGGDVVTEIWSEEHQAIHDDTERVLRERHNVQLQEAS